VSEENEDDKRVRVPKSVPVGVVLVLLSQTVAAFWFFADLRKDIEVLKTADMLHLSRDARMEADYKETLALLRGDILEVSRKADRIIERQASK
jgi:hypothetical protein